MEQTIQSRIVILRELNHWTQADLAQKLQMDLKTVYHWEKGNSSPSAASIVQLCKLFSVSSDYLLGLETHNAICLDSLSERDRNRFIALFQVYADKKYCDD